MLAECLDNPRLSLAVSALLVATACSDVTTSTPSASDDDQLNLSVEWAGSPALAKLLSTARAATAKYHDVSVATGDGYFAFGPCEATAVGAMGVHHVNPFLLGIIPGSSPINGADAVIDPAQPEILVYEPDADGTPRLVAVEFMVFRSAWDAVHSAPPTLAGVPFDQRFGSNAHGLADHYELHAWLWRNNPLGMFSPYNPNVRCP